MSNIFKIFLFLFLIWPFFSVSGSFELELEVYYCNNNGTCEAHLGEDSVNCLADCPIGPVCGNGICEAGENSTNCPVDCPPSPPPPPPPPPPDPLIISSVIANNISENSARVSWSTNNLAKCSVYWGINNDYSSGSLSELVFSLTHSVNLTSLLPDTKYYFKIECLDQNNSSASNSNNTFNTLKQEEEEEPIIIPNVENLRITAGDGQLTLNWVNPASVNFSGAMIKRSTSFFPNISQGIEVYRGLGHASGSERSFVDSGLINGNVYYYTIFSFNNLNNYSSGVGISGRPTSTFPIEPPPTTTPPTTTPPFEPPPTTTPPFEPPPTSTPPEIIIPPTTTEIIIGEIYFSDFAFSQEGRNIRITRDNSVSLRSDLETLITLPASKVLVGVEKIIFNLPIDGVVRSYLFIKTLSGDFQVVLPVIDKEENVFVSILVLDGNDKTIKNLTGRLFFSKPIIIIDEIIPEVIVKNIIEPITRMTAVITEALKPVREVAESPAGQSAVAVTVGFSAVNLAVGVPWWNFWYLLQFLFTQPFNLFLKRKGWGTVYNSITKKPVDLALVRLFDAKTKQLIASKVTDKNGRYMFLVDAGEYYLEVSKSNYEFPSKLLKRVSSDSNFIDLYYGENIKINSDGKSMIVANVPLDQEDKKISNRDAIKNFNRKLIFRLLSLVGPAIAIIYLLITPSWYAFAIVAFHFFIYLYFRRASEGKIDGNWGKIFESGSKKPIARAVTRIFSSEYGRMLEYYVTDNSGRYGFLVGNNKYYVTADKDGYQTAKTPIIDLEKVKEEKILARDLELSKADSAEIVEKESEDVNVEIDSENLEVDEKSKSLQTEEVNIESEEVKTTETKTENQINDKSKMSNFDLGSIDQIKEELEINPETESQAKKMDIDEAKVGSEKENVGSNKEIEKEGIFG